MHGWWCPVVSMYIDRFESIDVYDDACDDAYDDACDDAYDDKYDYAKDDAYADTYISRHIPCSKNLVVSMFLDTFMFKGFGRFSCL